MSSASWNAGGRPTAGGHSAAGRMSIPLAAALAQGGEMGRRIRDHDWRLTPLGAGVADWPPILQHTVATMLSSRNQIILFWGTELVALYNDAYAPVMGVKHPAYLGQPARQLWSEIWDVLGPLLEGVVRTGRSYRGTDHLHEFRTPLTLILGPVEDVLADPELPDRYQQPLAAIQRNGLRLLKLVNTMLDFSHIEAFRIGGVSIRPICPTTPPSWPEPSIRRSSTPVCALSAR